MKNVLVWLLVTVLAGVWGLAKAQPPTSCPETTGQVKRDSYSSPILDMTMFYSVYLPPCYDQTANVYPVLYLMHGSNDDDGQWVRLGLPDILDRGITQGALPPMVVILPFGNQIANENRFDAVSWENVFLTELMPTAETRYRIATQREGREIGGISRGGFWAVSIAFRHPDLFSAVGGHSAFFDPNNAPPEDNPLDLATTAAGIDTLRIALDRGANDYAAPGLDLMNERLTTRHIAHQYTVYPEGEHDNAYWGQHIADYIHFYAAGWQSQAAPAEATPEATPISQSGMALFLPVVGFPSLQTTLARDRLDAVAAGKPDKFLVLDETTAAALRGVGVPLAEGVRVVSDNALYNTLWRERESYTLMAFDRLTPRYRVLTIDDVPVLDGDLALYPFAFASTVPNFYPDKLTRLLLSGVTALTRKTRDALDAHGIEWAGEAILPYVSHADFFHTSNEVSMYPNCPDLSVPVLGGPTSFCSKPEHFELLKYLGVDIVELSGNHNNDYGFDAYRATLKYYHDNHIQTLGGGATLGEARQPVLLNHHGNRIAMVACNWVGPYYALADDSKGQPGAAYCDWKWLSAALPALAASNNLVVVTVQYQELEQYTPSAKQQDDFRALAKLGADVVIGTSAHKPQTFEFYDAGRDQEAFIHYGMGNLFFDQPFWGNMRFFMDELYIYDGRLLTVDLFPGIIDDGAHPRLMTPDERLNFLQFMFVQQNGF